MLRNTSIFVIVFSFLFSCNKADSAFMEGNEKLNYKIKKIGHNKPQKHFRNIDIGKNYISYNDTDFYSVQLKEQKNINILLINCSKQGFFPLFYFSEEIPEKSLWFFEGNPGKNVDLKCINLDNLNKSKIIKDIKLCGAGVDKDFFYFDKALTKLDALVPNITLERLRTWYN